jgi:hypothetical protein
VTFPYDEWKREESLWYCVTRSRKDTQSRRGNYHQPTAKEDKNAANYAVGAGQREVHKQTPDSCQSDRNCIGRISMSPYERRMAGLTILIAGITAVYAFFAGWQAVSMKDQSEMLSRQTQDSEAIQRAFVLLKNIGNQRRFVDPKTHKAFAFQFAVIVENSGTTPTRAGSYHVSLMLGRDKMPADYTFPDLIDGAKVPMILGPRAESNLFESIVKADAIKDVQMNIAHFYFYGWIKYRDIFRQTSPHLTEFCQELIAVQGDVFGEKPPNLVWISCPRYNCADDDCKKQE